MIEKKRSYRPWTGKEVAFIREHYLTKGGQWCAEQMGRSLSSVRHAAHDHAVATPVSSIQIGWTRIEEQMIRNAYASKKRGAVKECALKLGRPDRTIAHHAARMGLTTRKLGERMDPERVAFIKENIHLAPARIVEKMKRKGWNVGVYRVRNLIQQNGWIKLTEHKNDEIMTTQEVCEALGVTSSTISVWVKKGYLRADRNLSSASGTAFLFQPKHLARMLGQHPNLLAGRDVDIVWLISFLVQYGFYGRGGDDRDLYPRIIALKRAEPHLSLAEIAVRTGSGSADSVASLISRARKAGELPPISKAA